MSFLDSGTPDDHTGSQLGSGAPQSVGAAHFGVQFKFGDLGQLASFCLACPHHTLGWEEG